MIISRTPYRVSFFGGGTDYPSWYREEQGAVLSTTIAKYCYITCRYLPPYFPHRSRIAYSKLETVRENNQIEHVTVRNALGFLGIEEGLEIHHDGDVPARAGLGSSSAFTVGLLHTLHRLRGHRPGKMQLASEAIHIEQEMNRENVGAQDQVASALGGLNRHEFGPGDKIAATRIPVDHRRIQALEDHLMLCFTGVSRDATEVAAEQVRNTRHRKSELHEMVALVDEATRLLSGAEPLREFGHLLHQTWMLKRRLSSRISTALVDDIYAKARGAGAEGGKLLGAGGGGFLLLFVEPDLQPQVRKTLEGLLHIGFRFEDDGSRIIYDQPSAERPDRT